MPELTPNCDDFKSYHLNHYFLDLNDAWIAQRPNVADLLPDEIDFRKEVLNYIATKLINKNNIDTELLERKEHINANAGKLSLINSALSHLGSSIHTPINQHENIAYTTTLKRNISEINSHRLDMVWSRALIVTMIELFGFSFPQLNQLIDVIALVNGITSYGFYIVRGGVDALTGLSHLLPHSKYDDKNINIWDRLAFQAEQRYQRIINDLVLWAPVNYITFHYWTGAGWLGFAGNLLTAILLIGDYSLNCYVYNDKIRQFKKIMLELESKFGGNPHFDAYRTELILDHQKTLDNITFETNYQMALVASFILLWSPFCINSMFFTVIGAAACFLLQLFINQRNMYLNYANATCEYQKQIMFYEGLNRLFVQLLIPSLYLITGLVLMPMLPMISAPIMFGLATTVIAMLVKINDNFIALYKAENKKLPDSEEIKLAAIKTEDCLIKLGSLSAITGSIILGLLKTSLIGLNPSLGLGLALGLFCYASIEYISADEKTESPMFLGLGA